MTKEPYWIRVETGAVGSQTCGMDINLAEVRFVKNNRNANETFEVEIFYGTHNGIKLDDKRSAKFFMEHWNEYRGTQTPLDNYNTQVPDEPSIIAVANPKDQNMRGVTLAKRIER
jgi:hypothetical protein